MSKLLEYEAFSSVLELGSFRAAARQRGTSPSAVSKQVRALEERLGVRLLDRTTRSVAPTEAGLAFHERVRSILEDVRDAEQGVAAQDAEPAGRVRLSLPMDFGRRHLVEPLAHFAAAHPRLELAVEMGDRFVDPIEEGFDLVVRIGALGDSSLVARRLAWCRRVLCAAPSYLAANGTPQTPADLRRHRRIGFAYEAERTWRFRGPHGRTLRSSAPVRHQTNGGEMLRALLLEGQGISLAPTFLVADDLRAGRLQTVLTDALDADVPIHALYPHRRHLAAKVRAVVDFLVSHCGPRPYWDEGLSLPPVDAEEPATDPPPESRRPGALRCREGDRDRGAPPSSGSGRAPASRSSRDRPCGARPSAACRRRGRS